jgi:hypothetical protein
MAKKYTITEAAEHLGISRAGANLKALRGITEEG